LEFESNIGDLASIVKVEKRRSAVLEKVTIVLDQLITIRQIMYDCYLNYCLSILLD